MTSTHIHSILPDEFVRDFCRRNNILRLAVFGSVLRSDFTPDSDVDVLVEFKQNATPGLYFFDLQEQLAESAVLWT